MRHGFGAGLVLLDILYALGLYLGDPYSPPGLRRYHQSGKLCDEVQELERDIRDAIMSARRKTKAA